MADGWAGGFSITAWQKVRRTSNLQRTLDCQGTKSTPNIYGSSRWARVCLLSLRYNWIARASLEASELCQTRLLATLVFVRECVCVFATFESWSNDAAQAIACTPIRSDLFYRISNEMEAGDGIAQAIVRCESQCPLARSALFTVKCLLKNARIGFGAWFIVMCNRKRPYFGSGTFYGRRVKKNTLFAGHKKGARSKHGLKGI